MNADRLAKKRSEAKLQQRKSRIDATKRGTPGRVEHKAKARSNQKPYGGKMAR